MAAGRVKILLSLPTDKEVKHALMQFEDELLRDYPEIYHANRNKAVKLLRVSRYGLYRAAVCGRLGGAEGSSKYEEMIRQRYKDRLETI